MSSIETGLILKLFIFQFKWVVAHAYGLSIFRDIEDWTHLYDDKNVRKLFYLKILCLVIIATQILKWKDRKSFFFVIFFPIIAKISKYTPKNNKSESLRKFPELRAFNQCTLIQWRLSIYLSLVHTGSWWNLFHEIPLGK